MRLPTSRPSRAGALRFESVAFGVWLQPCREEVREEVRHSPFSGRSQTLTFLRCRRCVCRRGGAGRACARMQGDEAAGRWAGRWRENGRDEDVGGLACANRALVRCCREDDRPLTGRTESYSRHGVALRHVNASDVVAAKSARQRLTPWNRCWATPRARSRTRCAVPNARAHWWSNCWNCASQAAGFMPHRASSSWSVASCVSPPPASFVVGGVCRLAHDPAGQRPHDPQVLGYRYGDEWRI